MPAGLPLKPVMGGFERPAIDIGTGDRLALDLNASAPGVVDLSVSGPSVRGKITDNPGYDPERPKSFKNWRERNFWDVHEKGFDIRNNPQDYPYFDEPSINGHLHLPTLKLIADMAKEQGMTSMFSLKEILAFSIAETHGGTMSYINPIHASGKTWGDFLDEKVQTFTDSGMDELEANRRANILASFEQMKYIHERGKKLGMDKKSVYQLYSGSGKTIYGGDKDRQRMLGYGGGKAFGKAISATNFWEEKPQANKVERVLGKMDDFPELRKIYEERE